MKRDVRCAPQTIPNFICMFNSTFEEKQAVMNTLREVISAHPEQGNKLLISDGHGRRLHKYDVGRFFILYTFDPGIVWVSFIGHY